MSSEVGLRRLSTPLPIAARTASATAAIASTRRGCPSRPPLLWETTRGSLACHFPSKTSGWDKAVLRRWGMKRSQQLRALLVAACVGVLALGLGGGANAA